MASIYKRDKTWWVKFSRNGRTVRRSLKTANKRLAEREKQALEAELLRPHRKAPEDKDATIADFLVRWESWASANLTRKTHETQRGRFDLFLAHLKPAPRLLGDIGRQDVEDFIDGLAKRGRSKATINNYLRDVSAFYGHAARTFEMTTALNPAQGIKRHKLDDSPPPFLNAEEVQAIVQAAREYDEENGTHMQWYFMLGLYAGLRRREIGYARWDWMNWPGKLITVAPVEEFTTKSKKPRTIPMHHLIRQEMEPHAEKTGYVFESGRASEGRSHYRFDPKRSFRAILKRAGVEQVYTTGQPANVTVQVLRYTFGSRLVQEGESLKKVSAWMGHSSVRVTEKHYLHLLAYDEGIDRI